MTVKNDWSNGQIVTGASLNEVAIAVNAMLDLLVDAVFDFDPRLDDTRNPITGSVTLDKLAATLAAAISYLSGSGTVLRLGRNSDDSVQATQVEVWVDDDGAPSVRVARWNSSGEYISGNLQVGGNTDALTRSVQVNAAAGQTREVSFRTANLARWVIGANADPETGSDAGSNFVIRSRTDLGAAKTTVVSIDRQTGVVTLSGELVTLASTTTRAGLNIPPGTAPTAPVNGDVWGTSAGLFARINGTTGQLATAADVATAINNLINGAPGALDTLKKLADAINDDASYAATLTAALALKAPLTGASMTSLEQKDATDSSKKLKRGLSTIPASTTRVMMAPVARTTQFALTNSTTETDVVSMTLEAGALTAGSTFRIRVAGSVRNAASSGILTFKAYIGTNAAPQTFIAVPNQASSGSHKDIYAEFDVTVRTVGASGTFTAGGSGLCTLSGWNSIGSTTTGTSVVDTTAASPVVKLTAQWANASSLNELLLETAIIEQVV